MTTQSRTVRIFISSTFRDFSGERDLLVRRIFPELRRRCRERQVELVDVDLRWGITEAEAQQGKVLPICLAEIDRARPYFIGLLGERYGWVPQVQQYDPALVQEQPWLSEHAGGKSVTELEILHGVLNKPVMAGHAFFYFRAADYAQNRGSDYATESPEHREKLSALKDCIRQNGFPVVENYPNPEVLAKRVQEDIWKIIDAKFPSAEVLDARMRERQRHENYGATRLGLYLGGESYLNSLTQAHTEGVRTVLITGESGSGKSALLANWLKSFRKENPFLHTFVHHLGATNDAGEPAKLVRRWIDEIARVLGEKTKLPGEPDKLYEELPLWLAKASAQGRWIIVLDGLDKLREGRELSWLPMYVPEGIQLIVSCLPGEVLEAAQRRLTWERTLAVLPLQNEDRQNLIRNYLGKYRKSLTPSQEAQVLQHPLAGKPLFLRTLLEELRIFGVHEELERSLSHYLSSGTVDELYQRVLERSEQDTSPSHVRSAMEAIWASRAGLSEEELLAITGLVSVQWGAVRLGLDEAVMESVGRLVFAHDYLRQAVENRYLTTLEEKRTAHRKLGENFAKQDLDKRVAEELPWQWQQAGEKERLKDCLTHRKMFMLLNQRDRLELLGYWNSLAPRFEIESCYRDVQSAWNLAADNLDLLQILSELTSFLTFAGRFEFSVELLKESLDIVDHTYGKASVLGGSFRGELATTLHAAGQAKAAVALHREAITTLTGELGPKDDLTLSALHNLASALFDSREFAECEKIQRDVLATREKRLGLKHAQTINTLGNLANTLWALGRFDEAFGLQSRCLQSVIQHLGTQHPETLKTRANLAAIANGAGQLEAAAREYGEVQAGLARILGAGHPDTLLAANNFAFALLEFRQPVRALTVATDALRMAEAVLGGMHPLTIRLMNNTAASYFAIGQLAEAGELRARVVSASEAKYGSRSTGVWDAKINLAKIQFQQDCGEKAEVMLIDMLSNPLDEAGNIWELIARDMLGFFYIGKERHFDAIRAYSQLWQIIQNQTDIHPTFRSRIAFRYGISLLGVDCQMEALPLLLIALRWRIEKFGIACEDTLIALRLVHDCLCHLDGTGCTLPQMHDADLGRFFQTIGGSASEGGHGEISGQKVRSKILLLLHAQVADVPGLLRYHLACYECLSGNLAEAKRLIAAEIAADPGRKQQSLADSDLAAIHDFISST